MTQSQERRSDDENEVERADSLFDANAFNSSAFAATSPACTSIAMFRTPSQPLSSKSQSGNTGNPGVRCPICVAPFGRDGAVPKMLPCGHSFCAECIFSLCLHKEYYLLESIFCLKCGAPCDAGRALSAPVDSVLSEIVPSQKNNDNERINNDNKNNNVTIIHLTNQRGSARKRAAAESGTLSRAPVLGTATLSMMATPRRRVRARRDAAVKIPPPPLSLALQTTPLRWRTPTELAERCITDYGSDSCGTSGQNAISDADSNYEHVNEARSHRRCDRITPILTEMKPAVYSDYGSTSCRATAISGLGNDGYEATRWRAKFARRTRRLDAQLARARLKARDAYLDDINRLFDNNQTSCGTGDYRTANDSVRVTIAADYDGGFSVGDEIHYRPRGDMQTQHQRHYQQYASVLTAFEDAKRILRYELSLIDVDDAQSAYALTRRLNTLRKCLERCRFDFEERRVAASPTTVSVNGICACVETIVAFGVFNVQYDDLEWRLDALEKLTRGMRALHFSPISNSASNTEYQQLKRSLTDTTNLLIALLNEQTLVETIPLFDLGFAFIFRALKRFTRTTADANARQAQLWKMAQSAYSELLRVTSTHWQCADERRVGVVATMAQMCALFAEVCDTATVLLCIIEAARARVALNNATKNTETLLPAAERARAYFHLQRIDEYLLECRRIQKLTELRTRTRLLKKLGRNIGCTPDARTAALVTPTAVAKAAAAAVVARITPASRKRAATSINASSHSLTVGKSGTASESPVRQSHRRRTFFSWRRILPRKIFGNAKTTAE